MLPGDLDLPNGFKMTELGPLPEEWEVVRLGDIANLKIGRTPARKEKRFWSDGIIPWVSISDLNNSLVTQTRERISEFAFKEVFRGNYVPAGSLLLSFKLTIGKVGILGMPAVHNEAIVSVFPEESRIFKEFLFYLFQNLDFTGSLDAYVKGKTLNKKKLLTLPIPLPPLPEQRAIAWVLRTVQRTKEATERVIAALKELKKSLMKHLFTYGPVPLDAADQVALQDTPIGPIPAHWRVVRLGELWEQGILWIKNGFPQGRFNEQGKGVPHLRPFNVNDSGKVSLHQIKFVPPPPDNSPYWLRIGDIIFNNTNSEALVGKVAFFDLEGRFVLSNHMTIVRVQNPRVLSNVWLAGWLLYLWHQGFTQTLARRHVNQASIGLARLKSIPIPLPPLDEQREIARILQTVDRKIEAEENRKQALDVLFKTLLHNLMTAKIRAPRTMVERFASHEEG